MVSADDGWKARARSLAVLIAAALSLCAALAAPGCAWQEPYGDRVLSASSVAGASPPSSSRTDAPSASGREAPEWGSASFDYAAVPAYDGAPSVTVNGNVPFFAEADFSRGDSVELSELDSLGRAGTAFATVGPGTVADGARGALKAQPSGFQLSKYDWVPGKYLYNRCHLLGYKLTGIEDDARDLVTGTRYLNIDGMQPYEREVQAHVEETGGRVLYRVTPVFEGGDIVARGVLVEAASYEDRGASLLVCAWCYNVQPGVEIDYADGSNRADGTVEAGPADEPDYKYLVNRSSKVFHLPGCATGSTVKESNRLYSNDSRDELIERGYSPCGNCRP